MRGLALCLVAGAIAVAGCGSDNRSSSNAPQQQTVAASAGTAAPAGVSAKNRATPASLCAAEGKGKPKKQCVAGLTKLDKGKAANPKAACKGMSKKKTKGVRGKSPFAVCVSAAAKLMAAKQPSSGNGNTAADSSPGNAGGKAKDTSADDAGAADTTADDSSSDDEPDPVCRDADGNVVPFDSEDVEECDAPDDDTSASDSSNDDSGDDASDDDQ